MEGTSSRKASFRSSSTVLLDPSGDATGFQYRDRFVKKHKYGTETELVLIPTASAWSWSCVFSRSCSDVMRAISAALVVSEFEDYHVRLASTASLGFHVVVAGGCGGKAPPNKRSECMSCDPDVQLRIGKRGALELPGRQTLI